MNRSNKAQKECDWRILNERQAIEAKKKLHHGLVKILSAFSVKEMASNNKKLLHCTGNKGRKQTAVFGRHQHVTLRC